jgi:sec-independent protein translocase protein TatA
MFGFHAWDLLIVLLIALIIFGPRKLPEIGGAVGKSIREFKKATSEITEHIKTPEPRPLSSKTANHAIPPELIEALSPSATSVTTDEITHEGE